MLYHCCVIAGIFHDKEQAKCKQQALARAKVAEARAMAAEKLSEQRQWEIELLQKKLQVLRE